MSRLKMKIAATNVSPQQIAAINFAIAFANYPDHVEQKPPAVEIPGVILIDWYPDLTAPELMVIRRKVQRWLWDLAEEKQTSERLKSIEKQINRMLEEHTLQTQARIYKGNVLLEVWGLADAAVHYPAFFAAYGCALLLDRSLDLRRHLHICALESCQNVFLGGRQDIQFCSKQCSGLVRTRRYRGKK